MAKASTGRPASRRRVRLGRWRAVVVQTARDLSASNAPEWAAALAFYAVLSLFPLLLAGAVLISYFADAGWAADRLTTLLGEFLPRGEVEVQDIVEDAVADRRRIGAFSALAFLATGRRVFGALTNALNLVSDVDERTETLRRRALVELSLLAGIGLGFLLALMSRPLLDVAWQAIDASSAPEDRAFWVVRTTVRAALLLVAFYLVYAVVPRGRRHRGAALTGAAVATALFLLAQLIFGVAIGRLWQTLSLVYGPIAVATLLLLWAWYVALITLAGASLASHVKVMLVEGAAPAEAARRHGAQPSPPPPGLG